MFATPSESSPPTRENGQLGCRDNNNYLSGIAVAMKWWEILALEELLPVLHKRLHSTVMDIVDIIVSVQMLDPGSVEYARITHCQLIPHERVTELLRQLIIVSAEKDALTRDAPDGPPSEEFTQLCKAIREVGETDVAEQLEAKIQQCKKTGSPEKLVKCRLLKSRVVGCLEESIEEVCEMYHQVAENERVVLLTAEERKQKCLAKYSQYLQSLCRQRCRRSDMSCAADEFMQEDARKAYISMQALSQREALRAARAYKQKGKGKVTELEEAPDDQRSFPLENPSQLLTAPQQNRRARRSNGASATEGSSGKCAAIREPCKTMIMADAGRGKTMLCRRVMADFAYKERDDAATAAEDLRHQFDFVIPICVQEEDSLSTTSWSDFLGFDQLGLTSVLKEKEREIVLEHLSANSNRGTAHH